MDKEALQDALIATQATMDAMKLGGHLGYLTVDYEGDPAPHHAYFRDMESGEYTTLMDDTKLLVIIRTELGMAYAPVNGKDVLTKKDRHKRHLYAGMDAILLGHGGASV